MNKIVCHEINDAQPGVLEQFIGQKQVVARIKVALEAAWNDGVRLPHMLLTGPPGLGKSQLASILANEMGSELYEQLGQNIFSPSDLHGFLVNPMDREVALIDEIHELCPTAQTTLYRCMENNQIFLGGTEFQNPKKVKTANFTLLAATTDPHQLLQPLLDRFKLLLTFDYYSNSELEVLLEQRCKHLGWPIEEAIFPLIAARSRGTPRIALRLLESVRRTARSLNEDVITLKHFEITCNLENLDHLGLGAVERKYLEILAEHSQSSRFVRLNVVASIMGIPEKSIARNIESYLLRIGLITKTDGGRQLTQKGIDYLYKST